MLLDPSLRRVGGAALSALLLCTAPTALLAATPADTLVIADAAKPLAMAGIMGGQGSAVTTETRDIFLESAFFAPLTASPP